MFHSRRNLLLGAAGSLSFALTACAASDTPPPPNLDWLLGEWRGGSDELSVVAVEASREVAHGAWSGEPVYIIARGTALRFSTPSGAGLQLNYIGRGQMIGTVDRAPWLTQAEVGRTVSLSRVSRTAAG